MKILITEKQLELIIEEQNGSTNYMVTTTDSAPSTTSSIIDVKSYLSCVPLEFRGFIMAVYNNKDSLSKYLGIDSKKLMEFAKLSLGIMYRETKLGKSTEFADNAAEWIRRHYLGSLLDLGINIQNKIRGTNKTMSLGFAQFTPETWKRYGLDKKIGDFNASFTATRQGMATLFMLASNYKTALKNGLKDEPSQNNILKKYGIIKGVNGTGSNALDMALLSHNMDINKTLVTYCTTNHPLYYAPCNKTTYTPFNKKESFDPKKSALLSKISDPKLKEYPGTLKVNNGDVVRNYFPNLAGPNHTGIGYLEEVVKNSKTYSCF